MFDKRLPADIVLKQDFLYEILTDEQKAALEKIQEELTEQLKEKWQTDLDNRLEELAGKVHKLEGGQVYERFSDYDEERTFLLNQVKAAATSLDDFFKQYKIEIKLVSLIKKI